ncbi:hydroxyneurosporene desaturase [Acidimicrobiaceae bacterium]|nr:hydroxyneurosporene desaturase [Acidimicrobiaceae bacterium]
MLPSRPTLSGYCIAFDTRVKHVQERRHKYQPRKFEDNPLVVVLKFASHPDTFTVCELDGNILVSNALGNHAADRILVSMASEKHSVIVVGAGLPGITASLALAKSGSDVTLIDSEPTIGGLLRSYEVDGFIFDFGTHFASYTGVDEIDELLSVLMNRNG